MLNKCALSLIIILCSYNINAMDKQDGIEDAKAQFQNFAPGNESAIWSETLLKEIPHDLRPTISSYQSKYLIEKKEIGHKYNLVARYGNKNGKFDFHVGLAIDKDKNILVYESSNQRIERFDSQSMYMDSIGGFIDPVGFIFDLEGNLLVLDRHCVKLFDSNLQLKLEFGSFGTEDGQFVWPMGLALDNDGNIIVIDENRIQFFSPSGRFLRKLEFNDCLLKSVAVGHNNNIIVLDDKNRLLIIDSLGNIVKITDSISDQHCKILYVDARGQIVIGGNPRIVKIYSSEGVYLRDIFLSMTIRDISHNVTSSDHHATMANALLIDREGYLIVADSKNNNIKVYKEDAI